EYQELIEKFGVKPFSEILDDVPDPSWLMRRGIVFGHRDYERILEAVRKGEDFAVVTGMMPSGKMHIGHKMIVDQLRWYDSIGAEIFIPIANMEAYSARGIDFETSRRIAVEEYI